MKQLYNIDREFIHWYYIDDYSGFGSCRADYAQATPNQDWWLRQAYAAGARSMWQEIKTTLAEYATAVEGLDPEFITASEAYDRTSEILQCYIKQQRLWPDEN